jgi:GGDEF domain-containing protein
MGPGGGAEDRAPIGCGAGLFLRAVLKQVLRGHDVAARLHGALDTDGINASVGMAMRHPAHGLQQAWEAADGAMYAEKRRKSLDRLRAGTAPVRDLTTV